MTEQITEVMTAPDGNGQIHVKRSGPKGLLPSTWLNRSLRLEYIDAAGGRAETTATLLDLYPFGPVLNVAGAKTLICWERLVVCELIND